MQYSGGYALEEGEVENKSSANRYYGLGMTYKNGPFNMAGAVERFNWKSYDAATDTAEDTDDGLVVSAGAGKVLTSVVDRVRVLREAREKIQKTQQKISGFMNKISGRDRE